MSIIHHGYDSIRLQADKTYRAVRQGCWWVGDYPTVKQAKLALDLKDADGRYVITGVNDGGDWSSDEMIAERQVDHGTFADLFGTPAPRKDPPGRIRQYIEDIEAGRECKLAGISYILASAYNRKRMDQEAATAQADLESTHCIF